jgi:hypothetical protein
MDVAYLLAFFNLRFFSQPAVMGTKYGPSHPPVTELVRRDTWSCSNMLLTAPTCMVSGTASDCPSLNDVVERCEAPQDHDLNVNLCYYDGLAVDTTCVCGNYTRGDCTQSCKTDLSQYLFSSWINATCGNLSSNIIPSNWSDSFNFSDLIVVTSAVTDSPDLLPSCMTLLVDQGLSKPSCDGDQEWLSCVYPGNIRDLIPYPVSSIYGVYSFMDKDCACSSMEYGKICNSTCSSWWNRAAMVTWMGDICGLSGLPSNWKDLLHVQDYELMPWATAIQPSGSGEHSSCPSAAESLAVFAAVNLAMAILIPLMGRRTFVQRITMGLLGKTHSRGWLLTGPIGLGLHIASNAINAYITRKTPGYESVSIGALILLWCTRPRLAWMIAVLIPWQAEEAMYFSVAASTLLAEVVLQLFAAYTMGKAVQYGRAQRFYKRHAFDGAPHAEDALLMYAGAVLWLVVIFFAILACFYVILDLSKLLGNTWSRVIGKVKDVQMNASRSVAMLDDITAQRFELESMLPVWLPSEASEDLLGLFDYLSNMAVSCTEYCARLEKYLVDDADMLQSLERKKRDLVSKVRRLERKKQQIDTTNIRGELQTVEHTLKDAQFMWDHTPSEQVFLSADWNQRMSTIEARFPTVWPGYVPPHLQNQLEKRCSILKNPTESINRLWNFTHVRWQILEYQRTNEGTRSRKPEVERLRRLAFTIVIGMFACWLAQWLWWIGYIRTMGDRYCPPKLPALGAVWTLFSASGGFLGGSY